MTGPVIRRDLQQLDDEWFRIHGSVPSSSKFSEIITTKGEPSKSRFAYMQKMAACRVWGVYETGFESYDMKRGKELEPFARKDYAMVTDSEVEEVGFMYFDERLDRGCSTDGIIVGSGKPIEIKCPKLAKFVEHWIDYTPYQNEYFQQKQGELYISHAEELDYIVYYPGAPLFIKTIYRNEKFIERLDKALDEFNQELEEVCERLRKCI